MENTPISPEQAKRLLQQAQASAARSAGAADHRALAVLQLWAAGAAFLFLAAFMLVLLAAPVAGAGLDPALRGSQEVILLLAFLPLTPLLQGKRNKFRQGPVLRVTSRRLAAVVAVLLLLVGAAIVSSLGYTFPWWVLVVVAAGIISPLAVAASKKLKLPSPAREPQADDTRLPPLPPLLPLTALHGKAARGPVRWLTVALGVCLGLGTSSMGFRWFPVAAFVLTIPVLVALLAPGKRWGLANASSHWTATTWAAYGFGAIVMGGGATAISMGIGVSPDTGTAWVLGGSLVPWTVVAGAVATLPLVVAGFRVRGTDVDEP